MASSPEGEVQINSESDIVTARKMVRDATVALKFGVTDVTRVVTAASELVRNIYRYAGTGVMRLCTVEDNNRVGIQLTFEDSGPGIADVDQAMEVSFTTGEGLGLGLPGAKRLMDEIEVRSVVGQGTTVVVRKWRAQ